MKANPFLTAEPIKAAVPKKGPGRGRKPDPSLIERNNAIAEARRNGDASLEELADKYGISRERVRQISEQAGVDHRKANDAYLRRKSEEALKAAENSIDAIMMQFVNGVAPRKIAHDLNIQAKVVQDIIDERATPDILAARRKNQTARRFPDAPAHPRGSAVPRNDRYWTTENVMAALVKLARECGGKLPSSTQYQKISPTRDDLPSFPTVRNRVGRWSDLRVEVNRLAR